MTDTELDRQCALKVMGWKWYEVKDAVYINGWVDLDGHQMAFSGWSPTTVPAFFMQLIHKMRELRYGIVIASGLGIWQVRFIQESDGRAFVIEDASLGRAICLAALEAVK